MDFLTFILLMEELDPGLFLPVMIASGVGRHMYNLGNEGQRKNFLPSLLSVDKIGCTSITEPNVGSQHSAIQTRAVLDGDHYVINGSKMWISNAAFADITMVLARTDAQSGRNVLNFFIVDKKDSPFDAKATPILGDDPRIPHVGELVFEDCRIPKENLIGLPGKGLMETMAIFQKARCLLAMNSVVYAQRALDAAIRYAKERTQFGKRIGHSSSFKP